MNSGLFKNKVLWVVGVALVVIALFFGLIRLAYPFGRTPGGLSLRGLHGSLLAYAGDHQGWFPTSEENGYVALQKLYGDYCPTGAELAGISGNKDDVVEALSEGRELDATLSSWVYIPGYRLGDPAMAALVWETLPGLYPDGRRNTFGGRAVLLLDGSITNIPSSCWDEFVEFQDQLHERVRSYRSPSR